MAVVILQINLSMMAISKAKVYHGYNDVLFCFFNKILDEYEWIGGSWAKKRREPCKNVQCLAIHLSKKNKRC
jgi:hypothetical protein